MMLADAKGELATALGVENTASVLGPIRCKRFSMLIENGVVTKFYLEPESGITCSLSSNVLASL
jgi:2-Cys peroxiredoxin 5